MIDMMLGISHNEDDDDDDDGSDYESDSEDEEEEIEINKVRCDTGCSLTDYAMQRCCCSARLLSRNCA